MKRSFAVRHKRRCWFFEPKSSGANGLSGAVPKVRFSVKPYASFVRQPRGFQQVRQRALLILGQTVLLKGMYHDRTY